MNENDAKAFEAYKTLIEYCRSFGGGCGGCIFSDWVGTAWEMCLFKNSSSIPQRWEDHWIGKELRKA